MGSSQSIEKYDNDRNLLNNLHKRTYVNTAIQIYEHGKKLSYEEIKPTNILKFFILITKMNL